MFDVGCCVFLAALALLLALPPATPAASSLLSVNYSNLVSRADLHYPTAVDRSESGMPVGNGRMGSLVWTTPHAIRLQINRVDVFGNDSTSRSFPERNTDYCGGCAFVDVEFADYGSEVFPFEHTTQELFCYDGYGTLAGRGVTARTLAWHDRDVMAIELTDHREKPGTISINLRMLRPPRVRHLSHLATSTLENRNDTLILTQQFTEADYFCSSAVAVKVLGRDAEFRAATDMEYKLLAAPGQGTFTILISSASSLNRDQDAAAAALANLDAGAALGFDRLALSNREWWHDFWSKSFIHLNSADGVAATLEEHYTYYLYLMATSSRGRYPAKFNGMLWSTDGDRRSWGIHYWGANQSCLYNNALLAANHPELLDPLFDMLSGMFDSCSLAAQQQWGSKGIFIPETVAFDGLAPLPDNIAAEMRDLYLLRKPWTQASQAFLDYAATKQPHSSRWNWYDRGTWTDGRWVPHERGGGPYGPVTHIFSRTAKFAYQYWVRYEYTHDEEWLRNRAYPMLKGVAEFYRNYPNVKKGDDGKYHILHINSNESVQGAQDTDEEIASIMGILPVAIKASTLLNADANLRPLWQEFLANLAPLPRSDDPRNPQTTNQPPRDPSWIRGYPPVFRGSGSGGPDGNTMPQWFFDLCTLESDPEIFKIGDATLGHGTRRSNPGVLSKIPLVNAIMGRADGVQTLVPNQFTWADRSGILANRMDLREGAQTTSAQRLGNASDALHTALCYDLPPGPGQPAVIRVFAAWPTDWNADFTLLCRDGFLVTSSMQQGSIPFVELLSQLGGQCRLRNPWGDSQVTLFRDGRKAENLTGSLLTFDTRKGETILVIKPGTTPEQFKRTIAPQPL